MCPANTPWGEPELGVGGEAVLFKFVVESHARERESVCMCANIDGYLGIAHIKRPCEFSLLIITQLQRCCPVVLFCFRFIFSGTSRTVETIETPLLSTTLLLHNE